MSIDDIKKNNLTHKDLVAVVLEQQSQLRRIEATLLVMLTWMGGGTLNMNDCVDLIHRLEGK